MIEHARIKSGFDCEVLLGAEFFRMAIHTLFDSGQLESSHQIGERGMVIQVDRPTAAEIVFDASEGITIGEDGNPGEISGPADLLVTFPTRFLQADGGQKDTQLRLFLAVHIQEHESSVTHLMNRFDLEVTYAGMHQENWDWLEDNYTIILPVAMDKELHENIQVKLDNNILLADIQKVAIRKLPAEPGFQPCYAVYVNLPLKLGPTTEFIPTEPGALVPFVTVVLPPEPDDQPVDRGDAALGLNFLPPDLHLALGMPKEIYSRLSTNQMHTFTQEYSPGEWARPVKDAEGNIIGNHKKFKLEPSFYPIDLSFPKYPALRATSTTRIEGYDVETKIYLIFKTDDNGELLLDVDVRKPEADTSFLDVGLLFLGTLLGVCLAPVTGGLSIGGGLLLSGAAIGALHAVKDSYEEEGQKTLEGMVEGNRDSLLAFLTAIPSRPTIVALRTDPFYRRHFQVVTHFQDITLRSSGISLAGTVHPGSQDIPLENIQLVGRERLEEPVGELKSLIFQVPQADEIINPDNWSRPDPRKPSWFALPPAEAVRRFKGRPLKQHYLRPERVRVRSGQITEIAFDTGLALAPFEAGDLQEKQLLHVLDVQLVKSWKCKPYYRSLPDRYPQNNLSKRPPYNCALALQLGREFADFNQEVIRFANDVTEDFWNWKPDDQSKSAGVVACHAISTYPLMKDMISSFLFFNREIPAYTWDNLDNALLNPDWPPDEFNKYTPLNFLPEHSLDLQKYIIRLDTQHLLIESYVPLYVETLTLRQLIGNLWDYLWGRLGIMYKLHYDYNQW